MRKLLISIGLAIVVLGLTLVIRSSVQNPENIGSSVSFWRAIGAAVIGAILVFLARTQKCPNCLDRFKAGAAVCPHCKNVNMLA